MQREVFDTFLMEAFDALATLERSTGVLRYEIDAPTLQELAIVTHRIRGSAAQLGYPQVSKLAELSERMLTVLPALGERERNDAVAFVEQVAACLGMAMERISETGREGDIGLELSRLGGSELMMGVVRASPTAFARRGGEGASSRQDEARNAAAGAPSGAADELRRLRRNNAEDWEFFEPEAFEHVEALEAALEAMADACDEAGVVPAGRAEEAVRAAFRAAHTLKGAAFMVGVRPLGDLAHRLEDVLAEVRDEGRSLGRDALSLLADGSLALRAMLEASRGPDAEVDRSLGRLLGRLGGEQDEAGAVTLEDGAATAAVNRPDLAPGAQEPPSGPGTTPDGEAKGVEAAGRDVPGGEAAGRDAAGRNAAGRGSVRVNLARLDGLLNLAGDLLSLRADLERRARELDAGVKLLEANRRRMLRTVEEFEERYLNPRFAGGAPQATFDAARAALPAAAGGIGATLRETFEELEFDSYSDLNILARSVTEMANDAAEVQVRLEGISGAFAQTGDRMRRVTRELRGQLTRARMVPARTLFARLRRLTQDPSSDKRFRLETVGDGVEIDAVVLEEVADALVHLVKNAAYHGIEDAAARRAAGKEETGRIVVRAEARGRSVVIEVEDDGAGIDVARVRERAAERLGAEHVAALDDRAALELIFLPGLSTAEAVTRDAGRGVGMDAVAESVRRLGGRIEMHSQPGAGCRFTLTLPLTLLVSETLTVVVSGERLAFPLSAVRSLHLLDATELPPEPGAPVRLGGREAPLYRLADLLGSVAGAQPARVPVVLLEDAAGAFAVAADELLGIEEVTLRGLGELLSPVAHLAGAMLAPDGSVVPVLDPAGLRSLTAVGAASLRTSVAVQPAASRRRLLLADDSLSVRRVVGRMLQRAGFDVLLANDGQDALESIIAGAHFDAILTDLEMPRLNGYELIEEVRRREATRSLPVIVMTTRAGEKHARLAFELGANAYLGKPVDEHALLGTLREQLRGREAEP